MTARERNRMETAVKFFLMVFVGWPIAIAIMVPAIIWRGYVLSVLWGWFAVPQFGLPPLAVAPAIGLSIIVGMMTSNRTGDEMKDEAKKWQPFIRLALSPALALLVGWVVKQYV